MPSPIQNRIGFAVVLLGAITANAQTLSQNDKGILGAARSKYYNLQDRGFESATCSLSFDPSTIPSVEGADTDGRLVLQATQFTLKLDSDGPSLEHRFVTGSSNDVRKNAAPLIDLLTELVTGLFKTWPTKGFRGPIPPFDSEIQSVERTDTGYEVLLRNGADPIHVMMDKNYLVTEIVSQKGSLDERLTFVPTPDGLVYAGSATSVATTQGKNIEVKYELGSAVADGLRLPEQVHLKVDQRVDLKFALVDCRVVKGIVVHVVSPNSGKKQ